MRGKEIKRKGGKKNKLKQKKRKLKELKDE
jgi:hypothetical protein